MKPMTPNQSKLAAVALLLLAVVGLAATIAVPWWFLNKHYEEAIEESVTRLERYARVIGTRDSLQRKAQEVHVLEAQNHYLKSASPALAASELQEQVKAVLEQYGGKLNSIQVLPHKDEGDLRQIAVSLQLNAPIGGVKAILYALESARPYLFVQNFSVRVQNIGAPRSDGNSDPELFVQFDVIGYALRGVP